MKASTVVKAVMVMVSGHGQQILVVVEDGRFLTQDFGTRDFGTWLNSVLELFVSQSRSLVSRVLPIILVVVEDGRFFDVGLKDLGRRTGLNYA